MSEWRHHQPILLHPARHGEWAAGSPQRLFHHLRWSALGQMRSSFDLFLLALRPVWSREKGVGLMRAVAIVPDTTTVHLVDRPEPSIIAIDEVKVRVLRVGICGTDREEAMGGRARPPDGQQELVIGHEVVGQVVEVGQSVTRVRAGDYAVFTVRRGCGQCLPCAMNRPDMCRTGTYRERGIWGLDGYQAESVGASIISTAAFLRARAYGSNCWRRL